MDGIVDATAADAADTRLEAADGVRGAGAETEAAAEEEEDTADADMEAEAAALLAGGGAALRAGEAGAAEALVVGELNERPERRLRSLRTRCGSTIPAGLAALDML